MVWSIRDDVQIDRCEDRCHKPSAYFAQSMMRSSVILVFCALFHNSFAPDFRMCHRLFRVHAASRRPNILSEMDFRMCDCKWCKLDSFQTIDVMTSMPSHEHYGPAIDRFHEACNRLRVALEYLC